jgi:serine phosphatase RsbU (regulator of sigma subunit)
MKVKARGGRDPDYNLTKQTIVESVMPGVDTKLAASDQEPRRAELGIVDGLDLHAQYYVDRTGGDFFDAVRVGSRVVFLLSDIAGRRGEASPVAARAQEVFRAKAVELFGAGDVNLMEGTELLVQAINEGITGPAKEIRFAPTMVGCYDVQVGILAYVNAGGQTAAIRDSEGTRLLPDVAMPLGLFTRLIYDASMQAFEPGAVLLIVTKGVTQSMRGNTPFGAERVMEVLRSSKQESAADVCREVLEAAHLFQQGRWGRLAFWRKTVPEDMTALAMVRSR